MTTLHDDRTAVDQPIAAGGHLTVRLPAADVRIAPGPAGFVTVRSRDGRPVPDVVVVEPADDGVSIRLRERFGLTIGRRSRAIALDVAMPLDVELATDLASGDIETHGLRAVQRHRTASGDLRLLDAGGSIEINTVSGDTRIELAVPADLGFRSVSGDLDLTGGRLTALRVSTTSGDVRLGSPLSGGAENAIETMSGDVRIVAVAGIRVEARTVSGDLSSDLPHRTEGSMGRRTLILGDGSVRLAFRSVSGDLRIVRAGPGDADTIDPSADPARALPGLPSRPARPSLPPLPGASAIEPSASHDDSTPDAPAAPRSLGSTDGDERMNVLRALERGELDVATAMERLADLDAEDPTDG